MIPDRSVALHEAAHFVASYVLGHHREVYSVSIDPQNDYLGVMSAEHPDDESLTEAVVVLYAGFEGSIRYDPASEEQARAGAAWDDEKAASFIRLLGLPREETEVALRARAAALVAENWNLIEALADDLLAETTIDGEEATMVVEVAAGVEGAARDLAEHRRIKRAVEAHWREQDASDKKGGTPDAPLPLPAG